MRYLLLPSLAVLLSAESGGTFAGRWAMQSTDAAHRVFWIEVTGLYPVAGKFFGATGGRLEQLRDPVIDKGHLQFRVERLMPGEPPRKLEASVRLHLNGDNLDGIVRIGDRTWPVHGWRSPDISDRDDGGWRETKRIPMLDENLSKWRMLRSGSTYGWKCAGGVLQNLSPKADLLVSRDSFWNFRLHAEYRLPDGGNAGIGLRHHYELQLADDYGQPPDVHGNASLYSQIAPAVNASLPAGEWQTIDVTLIGRQLSVTLNSRLVIDRKEIRGLTGLAIDPYEQKPGPVSLQGDHGGVEYRNVIITALKR